MPKVTKNKIIKMNEHGTSVRRKKKKPCKYCNKNDNGDGINHNNGDCIPYGGWKCDWCDFETKSRASLFNHRRRNCKNKPSDIKQPVKRCYYCDKIVTGDEPHHKNGACIPGGGLKCEWCSFTTKLRGSLQDHQNNECSSNPAGRKLLGKRCKYCTKSYNRDGINHNNGDCIPAGGWKCEWCSFTTKTKTSVRQHQKDHCKNIPFDKKPSNKKCKYCNKIVTSDEPNHKNGECNPGGVYKCKWCSFFSKSKRSLQDHLSKDCKIKPAGRKQRAKKCEYCGKVDKNDGTNHNNGKCIPDGGLKCNWCSFTTEMWKSLCQHQRKTCKNIPARIKQPQKRCKYCDRKDNADWSNHNNGQCIPDGGFKCKWCTFTNKELRAVRHHESKACDQNPSGRQLPKTRCMYCYKMDDGNGVNHKTAACIPDGGWKCKWCSFNTRFWGSFRQHQRNYCKNNPSGIKPRRKQCKHCEKIDNGGRTNHHNGACIPGRAWKCKWCRFTTKLRNSFRTHQNRTCKNIPSYKKPNTSQKRIRTRSRKVVKNNVTNHDNGACIPGGSWKCDWCSVETQTREALHHHQSNTCDKNPAGNKPNTSQKGIRTRSRKVAKNNGTNHVNGACIPGGLSKCGWSSLETQTREALHHHQSNTCDKNPTGKKQPKKVRKRDLTGKCRYCNREVKKDGTNHNNGGCIPGGSWKCDWCVFETKSRGSFLAHKSKNCNNNPAGKKQRPKACKYCEKLVKDDGTNHNNGACIPGGSWRCDWCNSTFKLRNSFRTHRAVTCKNIPSDKKQNTSRKRIRKGRCRYCKRVVKKDGTNHNNGGCIPGGSWKCDWCGLETLILGSFRNHRTITCKKNPSSKINTHPATAKCKSNVLKRLRSRKNPKTAVRKAKLSFRNGICRICKTTVDLKNVSSHGKGNCTRSSQWVCHICRSRLTSRSDLIKHRLSNCKHQSKVTKKSVQKRRRNIKYSRFGYPCGHCGYMDTSFKLISMHLRILHRIECDTIYPDLVQDFGCYCCGEIFSSPASAFVHASACSLKLEKPRSLSAKHPQTNKIPPVSTVPVEIQPVHVMEQISSSHSPTLLVDVNCPVQVEIQPEKVTESTPTSDTEPLPLGPSLCLVGNRCTDSIPDRKATKPRANEALYKMELQEKGLFICNYCKTFADLKEFDQHQEYSCPMPADQQWFCKKCTFKTTSKVGLYKHIKTGCKLPETGFPCDRCMYVGSAWEDTFTHYGQKHGKFVTTGAVASAKDLKFTCFRCGYGSNSRMSVIVHMMNHLDKKVE